MICVESDGIRFGKWKPCSAVGGAPAAASQRFAHDTMTTAGRTPAVDTAEIANEYLISVELTDVSKDDVQLPTRDGDLTIQGRRRVEEPSGRTYHSVESGHGTFARRFSLPDDVGAEGIRAEHREGMLYLHLSKHQKPETKAIHSTVR